MTGRTLHVDLASGTGRLLDDGPVFSEWLGGSAAATELLFRHGDPKGDPLAPESPVIFTIGPFSALYPVATKTAALFKSPLSGELGESHAGGRLAMSLREAGIDALVITGRADLAWRNRNLLKDKIPYLRACTESHFKGLRNYRKLWRWCRFTRDAAVSM